jgi:hypothetical protein
MSIQLQMEQMPGYLAVRFIGAGVPEEIWRQFESIAEHCKRTKNNKLLIDAMGAVGKVSVVDAFLAAEESQIFARYGIKVALLRVPERMDLQNFAELVARNRWVNVRVVSDLQAAEEWLLK